MAILGPSLSGILSRREAAAVFDPSTLVIGLPTKQINRHNTASLFISCPQIIITLMSANLLRYLLRQYYLHADAMLMRGRSVIRFGFYLMQEFR